MSVKRQGMPMSQMPKALRITAKISYINNEETIQFLRRYLKKTFTENYPSKVMETTNARERNLSIGKA